MDLGSFSVSLAVKDLGASRAFYEKLGFERVGGDPEQGWIILRNGASEQQAPCTLGLFQGMFEQNILTFNPGWDATGSPRESFTDIRELQRKLEESGVELTSKVDEDSSGPGSFTCLDPDGNPILVDQHVG